MDRQMAAAGDGRPIRRSRTRTRRSAAARAWSLLVGAMPLLVAACGGGSQSPPTRVILISIDTCRPDHLSAYGYRRSTSPALDALADRGVLFENAFCQVPDTTPSHASILTSRFPHEHGAANGVPLRESFTTLAEILSDEGFATGAFVSGYTMEAEVSGLAQGFETYDDELTQLGTETAKQPNERAAEPTTDRAIAWLEQHADDPFFLFVHYFDPHARYLPPAPYDTMFPAENPQGVRLPLDKIPPYARHGNDTDPAAYIARYDGEIRYVDDQIARLLRTLEESGHADETIVLVTADHGESLTEHGMIFSHGFRLFDPSLRVPMILAAPGALPRARRVSEIAQSIDVTPTILELLDIETEAADAFAGISLVSMARREDGERHAYALAKTTKSLSYASADVGREIHDHYAVRTPAWKYFHSEDGTTRFLFDLRTDPGETRDILSEHTDVAEQLRGLLDERLTAGEVDTADFLPDLDDAERAEMRARLEALGYIR